MKDILSDEPKHTNAHDPSDNDTCKAEKNPAEIAAMALSTLNEREKDVLARRINHEAFKHIVEVYGISGSRARDIEARASCRVKNTA